jgi:hypothetical protein
MTGSMRIVSVSGLFASALVLASVSSAAGFGRGGGVAMPMAPRPPSRPMPPPAPAPHIGPHFGFQAGAHVGARPPFASPRFARGRRDLAVSAFGGWYSPYGWPYPYPASPTALATPDSSSPTPAWPNPWWQPPRFGEPGYVAHPVIYRITPPARATTRTDRRRGPQPWPKVSRQVL